MKLDATLDDVRAPESFERLYAQYFPYVKGLLYQFGVPSYRIEDDAQDIFVAFLKNDILGQFDETMVFVHDGKPIPTRFKKFLTVKVELYAKGKRDKAIRTRQRQVLECEMTPTQMAETEVGHSWSAVCRPVTEDDLSRPEVEEMVALIRSHLVKQEITGMRDLGKLFDLVVQQVDEGYDVPDRKKLMQDWFGVTVPGVAGMVTAVELEEAITVLKAAPGVKIRPYLEAIGSPLATATDYKAHPDSTGNKKPGYLAHLQELVVMLGGGLIEDGVEIPGVSVSTMGLMFAELRRAVDAVLG